MCMEKKVLDLKVTLPELNSAVTFLNLSFPLPYVIHHPCSAFSHPYMCTFLHENSQVPISHIQISPWKIPISRSAKAGFRLPLPFYNVYWFLPWYTLAYQTQNPEPVSIHWEIPYKFPFLSPFPLTVLNYFWRRIFTLKALPTFLNLRNKHLNALEYRWNMLLTMKMALGPDIPAKEPERDNNPRGLDCGLTVDLSLPVTGRSDCFARLS